MNLDWPNLIGGAVISIPIGLLIWWFTRTRGKILSYHVDAQLVIDEFSVGDAKNELQLSFRGKTIPRLSVAKIIIWNSGDSTIENDSFSTHDAVAIALKGDGEILTIDPIEQTNGGFRAMTEEADGANKLTFSSNYLNPHDAISLRVLHTARDPAVKLVGSMKGARLFKHKRSAVPSLYGGLVIVFCPLTLFVYAKSLSAQGENLGAHLPGVVFIVAFCSFLALALLVQSFAWRKQRIPLDSPPKE